MASDAVRPPPLAEIPHPEPLAAHYGGKGGGELDPVTWRAGPPPSRLGDREGIDERLAIVTGRIYPGEPQLLAPCCLCRANPAKSQTLVVGSCGIKGSRLSDCFSGVFGTRGRGSVHIDLGFLVVGLVVLVAEQCKKLPTRSLLRFP